MPVISFISSKGGVGKTTSALIFAGEIAAAGSKVIMIDADPNRPLSAWQAISETPSKNIEVVADVTEQTIIEAIEAATARAPFVIVDLEGTANMMVGYAISRSDFVLIPVQGSQLDAEQAAKSIGLIRQQERAFRTEIPYSVLFTRTSPAIRPRGLRYIEEEFKRQDVPMLETQLLEREAFRAPFAFGGTLNELPAGAVSNPGPALENARAYANEIVARLRALEETERKSA